MDKKLKINKPTPMMAQYLAIKQEAGDDVILFYRMGDFYEMFFDDAIKAAKALDIALTKRGKHGDDDIPMCGVPVHAAENYLQKLIKKGFRVAVCEQMEDPGEAKKRGYKAVVKREIVRIVTPGTITEDNLLDARSSNFIASFVITKTNQTALAWADISVGSFEVCQINQSGLQAELAALNPKELVLSEAVFQNKNMSEFLQNSDTALTPLPASKFEVKSCKRRLKQHFGLGSLAGFGDFSNAEIIAAGVLLDYLELTQAGDKPELSTLKRRQVSGFLSIDATTRISLEILSVQNGGRAGSLLSVIDKTVTGAGARTLAEWLARPLINVEKINKRLDAVEFFFCQKDLRAKIQELLKQSGDAARASSRLLLSRGGPRDLLVLAGALKQGELINAIFAKSPNMDLPEYLQNALDDCSLANKPELAVFVRDISKAFKQDCPLFARDGGFIKAGYRPELDNFLKLRDDSRRIIAGLQQDYASKTQIPSLKIRHNNVLGYFVEVTPKHADTILAGEHKNEFVHRQTLVSGVRFTTGELADLDAKIAQAGDKALALEMEIFGEFVNRLKDLSEEVRVSAKSLADIDVFAALGQWAEIAGCVRPKIDDSNEFNIEAGRHAVVEAALAKTGDNFTANDCELDSSGKTANRLTLITGPNMAGKSTYLRQNALMFVLAQSGSFVPAKSAKIGVINSLFSRVGAADDLARGRSTFMVEMIETAAILNQADEKSFVILDEIGRGTSTFDGLAIAWAVVEHLYEINKSRALFATHYHEMTELADKLEFAGNACLRAKEWQGDLVFLHDVIKGAADKSYGVQVAKLAGLPEPAIERARTVLAKLEQSADNKDALGGLPLFSAPKTSPAKPSKIDKAISSLDIDDLSPREALDILYELKSLLGKKES